MKTVPWISASVSALGQSGPTVPCPGLLASRGVREWVLGLSMLLRGPGCGGAFCLSQPCPFIPGSRGQGGPTAQLPFALPAPLPHNTLLELSASLSSVPAGADRAQKKDQLPPLTPRALGESIVSFPVKRNFVLLVPNGLCLLLPGLGVSVAEIETVVYFKGRGCPAEPSRAVKGQSFGCLGPQGDHGAIPIPACLGSSCH